MCNFGTFMVENLYKLCYTEGVRGNPEEKTGETETRSPPKGNTERELGAAMGLKLKDAESRKLNGSD